MHYRRALEAADIHREQTSIAKDSHSLKVQQSHERQQQQQSSRYAAVAFYWPDLVSRDVVD